MKCSDCGKRITVWDLSHIIDGNDICTNCYENDYNLEVKEEKLDSKKWYYAKKDEKIGPVSEKEIINLINKSTIHKNNLVWKNGMNNWQEINKVSKFEEFFTAQFPPPLPNAEREKNNEKKNSDKKHEVTEHKLTGNDKTNIKADSVNHSSQVKSASTWAIVLGGLKLLIGLGIIFILGKEINTIFEINVITIILTIIIGGLMIFFGLRIRNGHQDSFNYINYLIVIISISLILGIIASQAAKIGINVFALYIFIRARNQLKTVYTP